MWCGWEGGEVSSYPRHHYHLIRKDKIKGEEFLRIGGKGRGGGGGRGWGRWELEIKGGKGKNRMAGKLKGKPGPKGGMYHRHDMINGEDFRGGEKGGNGGLG